jgi:hypothetical protein
MTIFLCQPYEDEMLPGVFSRYARKLGVKNFYHLDARLRPERSKVGSFGSSTLLERETFEALGLRADDLMQRLTLYPYVACFVEPDKRRVLLDQVRSNRHAMTIRTLANLRYCELCFKDDQNEGRDEYWRRSHQMPGTLFCHRHEAKLFQMQKMARWREYYDPKNREPGRDIIQFEFSSEQERNCLGVAKLCHRILYEPDLYFPAIGLGEWRELAMRAGFVKSAYQIDKATLAKRYVDYYGVDYLNLMAIMYGARSVERLRTETFAQETYRVKLDTLLRRCFLSGIVDELGPSQWPYCPSRFADHGPQFPISHIRREKSRWAGACICGMRIKFERVENRVPVQMKITQHGHFYHEEAKRLASAGYDYHAIGRILGVNERLPFTWVKSDGMRGGLNKAGIEELIARFQAEVARLGSSNAVHLYDQQLYRMVLRYAPQCLPFAGRFVERNENSEEGTVIEAHLPVTA